MATFNFDAAAQKNQELATTCKSLSLAELRTDRGRNIGLDNYVSEGMTLAIPANLVFYTQTTNAITANVAYVSDDNGEPVRIYDSMLDRTAFVLQPQSDGTFVADHVQPTVITGDATILDPKAKLTRAELWSAVAGHKLKVVKIEAVKALRYEDDGNGKNKYACRRGAVVQPEASTDAKVYHIEVIA